MGQLITEANAIYMGFSPMPKDRATSCTASSPIECAKCDVYNMHPTKSPACVITAKEQYLQALIKEIEMRADLTPD